MNKQAKVESLIYYSKISFNPNHVLESSTADIQAKLDEAAADGWRLVDTTTTTFGAALYIYLFFEK